ncbi:MAG: protein translocase subunit SecF [Armatimonadetes bacterium]|nr:protein translocase subunit SecF [Armatimonadota bacterium]
MVDLFRERKWDLVSHRWLWFTISLIVIATGVVFWVTRGLNYGIDFTGGGLVTYQFAQDLESDQQAETLATARQAIEAAGVNGQLQLAGAAGHTNQLLVRTRIEPTPTLDSDQILTEQRNKMLPELRAAFPDVEEVAGEMVSPVVSQELLKNAVYAVAWGCVFILLWIRFRYFDFKWASSALVALLHDVLVLIGAFAITQKEINSPFVAAALTVVGYSVHDTIVIFDRIRENLRLRKGATFAETANISLLETMARSVNTVLTVLLVLIAVYLLGGASLQTFTFALIVGMVAGGYSSIFNAAQFLVVMKNREEKKIATQRAAGKAVRARVERAGPVRRPRKVVQETTSPPEQAAAAAEEESETPTTEAEVSTPSSSRSRTSRAERKKLRATRKRKRRF